MPIPMKSNQARRNDPAAHRRRCAQPANLNAIKHGFLGWLLRADEAALGGALRSVAAETGLN